MPGSWIGLFIALVFFSVFVSAFRHYVMRLSEARAWLARGATLVDVDSADEFQHHHPRLAINVPLEELDARAYEAGVHDTPVVVFAHRWRRGARAASLLRRRGFHRVINAAGLVTKERLVTSEIAEVRRNQDLVELAP